MNLLRTGSLMRWLGLLIALGLPTRSLLASPFYYGGSPLLTGPQYHLYFIWYGDGWTGDSATTILPQFINDLSGSSYMNIVTSYSTGSYTLGNQVKLAGQAFVNSSQNSTIYTSNGTTLAGSFSADGTYSGAILNIVNGILADPSYGSWASDTQGIFDVLTAQGITVTDYPSTFCGWHNSTTWDSSSLGTQYAFIGDPNPQNNPCATNFNPVHNSPDSSNVGADTMTSTIAHELFETITDPTARGWTYNGSEIADVCQNQFGTLSSSNGQYYNTTLNGTNYDLQQIMLNQGGGTCSMSLALASTSAPEPASFAVLVPALIGLAAVRWRRAG